MKISLISLKENQTDTKPKVLSTRTAINHKSLKQAQNKYPNSKSVSIFGTEQSTIASLFINKTCNEPGENEHKAECSDIITTPIISRKALITNVGKDSIVFTKGVGLEMKNLQTTR